MITRYLYYIYNQAKRTIFFVVFILALVSVGCIGEEEEFTHENTTIVGVGDAAPDFEVELLGGERITLSSLHGQVTMLILFSTSCPDCQAQFAAMQSLISQQEPQFRILAISREESTEATAEFIERYGVRFDVGTDPDRSIYNRYASRFVPRNFLIDREGKVKALTVEYEPNEFLSIWHQAESLVK